MKHEPLPRVAARVACSLWGSWATGSTLGEPDECGTYTGSWLEYTVVDGVYLPGGVTLGESYVWCVADSGIGSGGELAGYSPPYYY